MYRLNKKLVFDGWKRERDLLDVACDEHVGWGRMTVLLFVEEDFRWLAVEEGEFDNCLCLLKSAFLICVNHEMEAFRHCLLVDRWFDSVVVEDTETSYVQRSIVVLFSFVFVPIDDRFRLVFRTSFVFFVDFNRWRVVNDVPIVTVFADAFRKRKHWLFTDVYRSVV